MSIENPNYEEMSDDEWFNALDAEFSKGFTSSRSDILEDDQYGPYRPIWSEPEFSSGSSDIDDEDYL